MEFKENHVYVNDGGLIVLCTNSYDSNGFEFSGTVLMCRYSTRWVGYKSLHWRKNDSWKDLGELKEDNKEDTNEIRTSN